MNGSPGKPRRGLTGPATTPICTRSRSAVDDMIATKRVHPKMSVDPLTHVLSCRTRSCTAAMHRFRHAFPEIHGQIMANIDAASTDDAVPVSA